MTERDTPIPVLDEKVAPRVVNAARMLDSIQDTLKRDMNPSDRALRGKLDYAIRELKAARDVLNEVDQGEEITTLTFSAEVNGLDIRATLINSLVESRIEHIGGDDPAMFADNVMVALGFDTGYDESGDYTPGYREYMVTVGLVTG